MSVLAETGTHAYAWQKYCYANYFDKTNESRHAIDQARTPQIWTALK